MEAPSSPREPSPTVVVVSAVPAVASAASRKRKHNAIAGAAASPAPSESRTTPAPNENVVLPTKHVDLSTRPRLTISRHPAFIPIVPGSPYYTTEPLCNNRLNFRYCPAGLAPPGAALPFRTIESAPATFRVSWEDRSPFLKVTQDGLGLLGEMGFRSARCNAPIREGKWYMEIKIEHGGGERPAESKRRQGSHVRLGWARREAPLNGPAGLDGYSYALRDLTGEKVHLSRLRPYGRPFKSGDVVGMYISLPPRRAPDRKDARDPAHIKRERIAIDFKGQEYFESLEYSQCKEMTELMDAKERAKATSTTSMPSSSTKKSATVKNVPSSGRGANGAKQDPAPLRPLPTLGADSHIAFFVNGECQGIAFQDLFDYLPLRAHTKKTQEKKRQNKEGFREHKENPFDDGSLGYYPFISLFNEAKVKINPGPDFNFPPPPDIDAVLSSAEPADADIKPLSPESKQTWRPICERYPEYIAEQQALDELEETEAQTGQKPELPVPQPKAEPKEKKTVDQDALELRRAKRRQQAAARRERKAREAREEAERKKREEEPAVTPGAVEEGMQLDDERFLPPPALYPSYSQPELADQYGSAPYSPPPTVASSVDVHMPAVSRNDASEYNSEYEEAEAAEDDVGEEEMR